MRPRLGRPAVGMILICLVLSACGTSMGRRESWPGEPGRTTRPLPRDGTATPQPLPSQDYPPLPRSIPADAPRRAEDVSGPAVQSLLAQARAEQAANHPDQALASLERALRIEPRNPFVWQMLASAHLALGQMDQAESTAEKSNSLARGNPYVEVENWRVIAAVKQSAGDGAAALQAQMRVDELNRLLGPQ